MKHGFSKQKDAKDAKDGERGALKAPFPWFGGKSRAASLIWPRFGDVKNYVEPFAGSLAVLLSRPHAPRIETVNDLDQHIANFWRAVRAEPDAVAEAADWPVNECDLTARHYWLVTEGRQRLGGLLCDPRAYDVEVAGWWVWGLCSWMGSGWCSGEGPWQATDDGWCLRNAGQGINRKRPHLGNAGQGVNRQRPHLSDAGQGVNRKLPHLGDAGKAIRDYMRVLSIRLRRVRVCCGDWTRVLTPSVTFRHGPTAVLLDPPYDHGDRADCYSVDDPEIAGEVREWAIENGDNELLRIALCGYQGNVTMPRGWTHVRWVTAGGMASTAKQETQAQRNRKREVIWFSPHCLAGARQRTERRAALAA